MAAVKFWGKTREDGMPGIDVVEHLRNVGCVASEIAFSYKDLLRNWGLKIETTAALAALHDIGKISPGFQRKCEAWLDGMGLTQIARRWGWESSMEPDHGKISHSAIQAFLKEMKIHSKTAKFLSAALGGHHGRLARPEDRGYLPQRLIVEKYSGIDWEVDRRKTAEAIWRYFNAENEFPEINETSPSLWWLAGLTTVSDWIGSDERFFSPDGIETRSDPFFAARTALSMIGMQTPEFTSGLTFHDLFHDSMKPEIEWLPNEMQQKTLSAITAPGVYIIEAPMGMGKTEAALWAAYQLMVSSKACGIYFALPTQATSNRIHLRLNEFVKRIAPQTSGSRLIHANSWLMDTHINIAPSITCSGFNASDDARDARDWFASAKRALIAPFGVGTVDQALLGVVAAKHFFVRHFALSGKVVIIDEVHSYDLYTGTLIDKLINTLEGLGCTVIVLSATLTEKRSRKILPQGQIAAESGQETPYPLIAGRKEGMNFPAIAARAPDARDVHVMFSSREDAEKEAAAIAEKDGCVIWICNTIDNAQKQFLNFRERAGGGYKVGLLHSRFPFWRREELEKEWMELLDKNGGARCGSILISTQVVEQSVDLDADFMVTELAPTDMLLQRLGRLWRHKRDIRCTTSPKICIIEESASLEDLRAMKKKDFMEVLGSKAYVYEPYVLLRSLQVWKEYGNRCIKIPTQIRNLLEETYRERADDPDSWRKLFDEGFVRDSNERFKATMASHYWQPQLPDEEGVQTRLNDQPTVPMVICTELSVDAASLSDNTTIRFETKEFQYKTAQAIHRNLVKVPKYCFAAFEIDEMFSQYLHGSYCIGLLNHENKIEARRLNEGYKFSYTNELGLAIEKPSCKE